MWTISIRLVPLFAFVVGLGTAFGIFLDYSALRTSYQETVQDRLLVVADSLGASVEALISLGQPVAGQAGLQESIRREASLFETGLQSIDIVEGGRITMSSVPERVGQALQDDPRVLLAEHKIQTALGTAGSALVVRYDRDRIDLVFDRIASELTLRAWPALILALAGVAAVGVIFAIWLRGSFVNAADPATMTPEAHRAYRAIIRAQSAVRRSLDLRAGRQGRS